MEDRSNDYSNPMIISVIVIMLVAAGWMLYLGISTNMMSKDVQKETNAMEFQVK